MSRGRLAHRVAVALGTLAGLLAAVERSTAEIVVVDGDTRGYYNAAIGRVLDGTGPQFPLGNLGSGDPTINPAPEPDLSAASGVLGSWLSPSPLPLGPSWSGLQPIPNEWRVNTETAIIYRINAGPNGVDHLVGHFGVDNGIFVWVNGEFRFGAVEPGFATAFEYADVDLGSLPPGTSYVQVLREDHGQGTGYVVQITRPDDPDNHPPVCDGAVASPSRISPPNRALVDIAITGVVDPDDDPLEVRVTGVTQDESLRGRGFGNRCPDAIIHDDGTASLRAERGSKRGARNGRVYHVSIIAEDGRGGSCAGNVRVCIPRSSNAGDCIEEPLEVDSTAPCD